MTSSLGRAAGSAPARSDMRARSTRWRPGCSILGAGPATRLLTYLVGLDKTYEATIRLGESTNTDDAEGESTRQLPRSPVTDDELAGAVASLTGDIPQCPSTVSRDQGRRQAGLRPRARRRGGRARRRGRSRSASSRCSGSAAPDGARRCRRPRRLLLAARTSAPSPATWERRWARAAISPRCAAPASGRSTSPRAGPVDETRRCWRRPPAAATLLPDAGARRAARAGARARRPHPASRADDAEPRGGARSRRRADRPGRGRRTASRECWPTSRPTHPKGMPSDRLVHLGAGGRRGRRRVWSASGSASPAGVPTTWCSARRPWSSCSCSRRSSSRSSSPAFGNLPTGSGLEFWVYLISAALLPPAAAVWGLVERTRWSTIVIARRVPRGRRHGVPDGADLVRAGGLARARLAQPGPAVGSRAMASGSSRAVGVGRVLIAVYAILALAATARSLVQIITKFETAPVAYLLSALAGVVYIVATVALLMPGRAWYRVAWATISLRAARRAHRGHAELGRSRAVPGRHGLVGVRSRLPVHPARAAGARAAAGSARAPRKAA